MKKMNLPTRRQLDILLDKTLKEALEDKDLENLIKNLKLPSGVAKKNVSKLEETTLELKNCKSCKGLYECKNKVKGYVFYPSYTYDKLDFDYIACKYEKKRLEEITDKETSLKELEQARMKDIDIKDKNRVDVIKGIKKFYDEYDYSRKMKGMYVHGSFGSGKTFLISALFNELKISKDVDSIIEYFPELLRNLREDFDLLESKINNLKTVPLLLIDDIGAENLSAWGRDEVLGTILQYRMNEYLPTFFTSNLTIKELESHLAVTRNSEDKVKARRIIERITQLSEIYELTSVNRRK